MFVINFYLLLSNSVPNSLKKDDTIIIDPFYGAYSFFCIYSVVVKIFHHFIHSISNIISEYHKRVVPIVVLNNIINHSLPISLSQFQFCLVQMFNCFSNVATRFN